MNLQFLRQFTPNIDIIAHRFAGDMMGGLTVRQAGCARWAFDHYPGNVLRQRPQQQLVGIIVAIITMQQQLEQVQVGAVGLSWIDMWPSVHSQS